eukprot:CAMPEP_0183351692 /NCGR_PEP_ID=MMETSP0164_2-20130417/26192_1 /TAXON_ID=221442 /ORGANISM="Coccolithus pelagicus ssp braarudi, Strain PLY182g" /LENGTH=157 /DNA_ID=CAMNT_0025523935 /DNA_START=172 /DNA_END=645 /DNA_ORIENTATION=+
MLNVGEQCIRFTELDTNRIERFLASFPGSFQGWRESEWGKFGLAPISFTYRSIPGGVRLIYFAGREPDGSLDIIVEAQRTIFGPPSSAVVLRPKRGLKRRERHEKVIFTRLQIGFMANRGLASELASRQAGPSRTIAKTISRIDSACAYDKWVTKRY